MYLGFKSISDFAVAIGSGSLKTWVATVAMFAGSATTATTVFLNEWVIADDKVYTFLMLSLAFDWITGVLKGSRSPEGFRTGKAFRILPIMVTHLFIVATINQIAGVTAATVAAGGITTITLLSIIKNASVLGWIDGRVKDFLEKNVDIHKNKQRKIRSSE